jgi:hypothetical protein
MNGTILLRAHLHVLPVVFSLIVFQQAVLGSLLMDRQTDGHIRKYTIPELC